MTHTNQQQKTKAQLYFFITVSVLVALVIGYVYFLSVSVMEVVARKQVDADIAQLSTEISELESNYINKQHAVSQEIAMQEGFVKTADKTFIDKRESSLVLSDRRAY